MKLFFQNANGNERVIANVDNADEAMIEIKKFCDERDFKIPYYRYYGSLDDNGIKYDVGSWSEFFVLRKDQLKGY